MKRSLNQVQDVAGVLFLWGTLTSIADLHSYLPPQHQALKCRIICSEKSQKSEEPNGTGGKF